MPAPEQLIAAYGRRLDAIRTRAGAAVAAAWVAQGGLTDAEAARFASTAATASVAAQNAVSGLTAAYMAAILSAATGTPLAPLAVALAAVTGASVRNGADPLDVYLRAAVTARTAISQGRTFDEAMAAAGARARDAAETDVQLAHRATAREAMAADRRIVGYRRVLTGRSCMLCATASTQRYRTDDLLPIHGHCDCRIAPIVGDRDPGQIINRRLVRDLRAAGGSSYWRQRGLVEVDDDDRLIVATADGPAPLEVATRTHGELGPTLVPAHQHFDGPSQVAA